MPSARKNAKRKSVFKNVTGGVYHDEDPYAIFPNKATARADRSSVNKVFSKIRKTPSDLRRNPRVPTFYTVMFSTPQESTRADGTTRYSYSSVPQGPHSVPFHALWRGLVNARKNKKLQKFVDKLPQPRAFDAAVNAEVPNTSPNKKVDGAKIAKAKYKYYFKKANDLADEDKKKPLSRNNLIKLTHTLNKAFNLHPYASSEYMRPTALKKTSPILKVKKGQRPGLPLPPQVDYDPNSYNARIAAKAYIDSKVLFLGKYQ